MLKPTYDDDVPTNLSCHSDESILLFRRIYCHSDESILPFRRTHFVIPMNLFWFPG